jgi:hypothetical protein
MPADLIATAIFAYAVFWLLLLWRLSHRIVEAALNTEFPEPEFDAHDCRVVHPDIEECDWRATCQR